MRNYGNQTCARQVHVNQACEAHLCACSGSCGIRPPQPLSPSTGNPTMTLGRNGGVSRVSPQLPEFKQYINYALYLVICMRRTMVGISQIALHLWTELSIWSIFYSRVGGCVCACGEGGGGGVQEQFCVCLKKGGNKSTFWSSLKVK